MIKVVLDIRERIYQWNVSRAWFPAYQDLDLMSISCWLIFENYVFNAEFEQLMAAACIP
jgi:hypothetical protein